ncbi:MAG: aldo/keto reductase [Actinobacteria bacterium]|nr:aldo/keto reductase [Actinomycetota bacterium]
MSDEPRTLAGSDVTIPVMGVGCWAWGDKRVWGMGGYDASLTMDTIADAWRTSIDAGVTLFDTAEAYGEGESERIIGKMIADDPERASRAVIASKFMPMPWKLNVKRSLVDAAKASRERLGVEAIDLYQIHGPISLRGIPAQAEALAEAHAQGVVRAVGVSNFSPKETRQWDTELRKRDLRLASNQVEFSLLRTIPISSGLLETCARLDVVLIAYSPMGQGRLTGKYSASNPPPGKRNFSTYSMDKIDPLVDRMRRIGAAHNDRTPAQVSLRWLIERGAVPIPGAKNGGQAADNAGALGWTLTAAELAELNEAAFPGIWGVANRIWQHG